MSESLAVIDRTEKMLTQVEDLAKEITLGQFVIEQRFVQLGELLLTIRTESLYKNAGFASWGTYLKHLAKLVGRERSSLFGYTGTVEHLLPVVGREALELMGINKALLLKRGMKYSGKNPSPELLAKAVDPQVKANDFQTAVNDEFRIFVPTEEGTWHDMGFYCDADEWEEIQQAVETAKRVDPPISNQNSDSFQNKEVILRFAREFVSSYPGGSSK